MANFPTLHEVLKDFPTELVDAFKDTIVKQTIVPAHTIKQKKYRFTPPRYARINGVVTMVSPPKVEEYFVDVQVAEKITNHAHGGCVANFLMEAFYLGGVNEFVKVDDDTWAIHTYGVKFTDGQGVKQDIPPRDLFIDILPNGVKYYFSNDPRIYVCEKVDNAQFMTSFFTWMVEENGKLANCSIINGKPWNEVAVSALMTPWGRTGSDFVWRWWMYGNNHKGLVVDGNATEIVQHPRANNRGSFLNIGQAPSVVGSYDNVNHTFNVPLDNGDEPVYVRLQAEFLPAQYKQWSTNCWYLPYGYGLTESGIGMKWPTKHFDPNAELY
jgi:hypothetical protein